MKISRILATLTVLFSLVGISGKAIAQTHKLTLQNGEVPIGSLGSPIGSYLTIEGVREPDKAKLAPRTLVVDAVNGFKLSKPVSIWVDNVAPPENTRCVLKGYETLQMAGVPPAYMEAGLEASAIQQSAWRVDFSFVTMSVVSPGELKLIDGSKPNQIPN